MSLKRLLFRLFKPRLIRALDFAALYKSQWLDGGIPVELFDKRFNEEYLKSLVREGYLTTEDEPIGVDDIIHKVYVLTPEARSIAVKPGGRNNPEKRPGLTNLAVGISSTVIGGLVLAYIFGVGR